MVARATAGCVAVFSLGGTIAMTPEPGRLDPLKARLLLHLLLARGAGREQVTAAFRTYSDARDSQL